MVVNQYIYTSVTDVEIFLQLHDCPK